MTPSAVPALTIVGPGRMAQALGRRLAEGGATITGFLGRTIQAAADAVGFCGAGRVLDAADLARAEAVLLAVQDDQLARVVAELAPCARTDNALWFHCSGSFDLDILAPLAERGARVGSLHPLCPAPAPDVGYANLPGKPALLQVAPGDRATAETLVAFAETAGLRPIVTTGGNRLLYHAACVLAANGLTALYSVVEDLLAAALPDADDATARGLAAPLMGAALDASAAHGPAAALSGPVPRGDVDLVRRQLAALELLADVDGGDPHAAAVFQSLLRRATALAESHGTLRDAALDAMRDALAGRAKSPDA